MGWRATAIAALAYAGLADAGVSGLPSDPVKLEISTIRDAPMAQRNLAHSEACPVGSFRQGTDGIASRFPQTSPARFGSSLCDKYDWPFSVYLSLPPVWDIGWGGTRTPTGEFGTFCVATLKVKTFE